MAKSKLAKLAERKNMEKVEEKQNHNRFVEAAVYCCIFNEK